MAFSTLNSFHSVRGKVNVFIPPSIPGIQLWLDANDRSTLTLSGNTVTSWGDKSGFSRNAVPSTGGSPTYNSTGFNNLPSIQLNLTSLQSAIPSGTFTAGSSIFVIFKYTGTSPTATYSTLVNRSLGAAGQDFMKYDSNNFVGASNQNSFQGYKLGSDFNANLIDFIYNSTSFNEYLNGTSASSSVTANTLTDIATQFYIGTRTDLDNGIAMIGVISEIVVYNASITTAQRQKVEGYLSWKWGIQTSLPVSHPYYKSKP
jgi:hypothetical protein